MFHAARRLRPSRRLVASTAGKWSLNICWAMPAFIPLRPRPQLPLALPEQLFGPLFAELGHHLRPQLRVADLLPEVPGQNLFRAGPEIRFFRAPPRLVPFAFTH